MESRSAENRVVANAESLPNTLLPTTLVGSYPQPDWLIDRRRLAEIVPPRARARELWRVEAAWLEQAQDDATLLAIRDQERAGIDVVTDGEMRRESYSNRFATALEGMDSDNPAQIPSRTPGRVQIVPRVVGTIRRRQPVQVRDVAFLRANTDRPIKITIPGPFTMTQQLSTSTIGTRPPRLRLRRALNEEIKDLFAAGADVVQLDEPFLQALAGRGAALRRAGDQPGGRRRGRDHRAAPVLRLRGAGEGASRPAIRSCPSSRPRRSIRSRSRPPQSKLDCAILARLPGKQIILGVLDLGDMAVETPATRRRAHPPRARLRGAGAADRGAGLRAQVSAARRGVRQAAGDGRRRGASCGVSWGDKGERRTSDVELLFYNWRIE